jgi:hypothetical protein
MVNAKFDIDHFINSCLKKKEPPTLPRDIEFEEYNGLTHNHIYDIPIPVRHLVIEEAKIDSYLVSLSSLEKSSLDNDFINLCRAVRQDLYQKRKAIYKKEIVLLTKVLKKNKDLVPFAQLVLLNDWKFTYTLTDISAYDQDCRLILCKFF